MAMIKSEIVWTVARCVFGLFFLTTGLWIWVHILTGLLPVPVQPTAQAQAFTNALDATGFMNELLGLSYLAGGTALLTRRTAPLGLVLLGPSVVVILFFHLELSGQVYWGPFVAIWFAALCWRFRQVLLALVGVHLTIDNPSSRDIDD
jgi:hypothetical protein